MATAARTAPKFTDEQISEVLSLIKGADSVELKLTVPAENRTQGATALGVDPLDAEIRQVFFFDTPDLKLNQAGVVVRGRRVQRQGDDTVSSCARSSRRSCRRRRACPSSASRSTRCPVGSSAGHVQAGARDTRCQGQVEMYVRDTLLGGHPIRKLFSKEQRAFYEAHAPEESRSTPLRLGPIFVLKLKFEPKGSSARWWPSCGCTPTIPDPRALHEVPAGRDPQRGR